MLILQVRDVVNMRTAHLAATAIQIVIYGSILWLILDLAEGRFGREVAWGLGIVLVAALVLLLIIRRKR